MDPEQFNAGRAQAQLRITAHTELTAIAQQHLHATRLIGPQQCVVRQGLAGAGIDLRCTRQLDKCRACGHVFNTRLNGMGGLKPRCAAQKQHPARLKQTRLSDHVRHLFRQGWQHERQATTRQRKAHQPLYITLPKQEAIARLSRIRGSTGRGIRERSSESEKF